MFNRMFRLTIHVLFLISIISPHATRAAYIESIDTTDVNGYGLDSAFKVNPFIPGSAYGPGNSSYGPGIILYGYGTDALNIMSWFGYSFDDIKMAPQPWYDSTRPPIDVPRHVTCFMVKRKDSTYAKVVLLDSLSPLTRVFKYGTNTTPNAYLLDSTNYDRSVKYKPNNVSIYYKGSNLQPKDSLSWESPLPNNNHLLGYEIFHSNSWDMDTTAPINLAQWDSIAFTDSLMCVIPWPQPYLNIVAVYSEGKSDFLQGWPYLGDFPENVKHVQTFGQNHTSVIKVIESLGGFCISVPTSKGSLAPSSLSIFTLAGQRVVQFSNIASSNIFFSMANRGLTKGVYILRAEMPDRTVLSQPFLFAR